jgi:hypothetical protein
MIRTVLSRRRREDQRVDDFLHAIALSERYTVDPDWQLHAADDTHPLPLSLVRLLVAL